MPFHDSMPRFMNFRRVFDLLELQKQVPQRLLESHGAVVFEIHPISCMGHKHKPMDTYMILQPMLVHQSMCMCFNFELCTSNG